MPMPSFAKLLSAAAFVLPRPRKDLYAWRVARSGLFDRAYYAEVSAGVNALYRAFPERHYVRFGEMLGWQPNPDFSSRAYLRHNPDLIGGTLFPFEHYIRVGKDEDRIFRDLPQGPAVLDIVLADLRSLAAAPRPAAGARVAVHVHIYYLDLWDEFAAALDRLGVPFDLYVTVTFFGDESEALRDRIAAERPEATVLLMPNHGRDIFPFLHLVNAGVLSGYEAVCKLHTKRSPHRTDGDTWRRHLVAGLLPEGGVGGPLAAFLADPGASLWVADGQHYDDTIWWGSNRGATDRLLRRVELAGDPDRLSFPAGSMYWIKPALLATIRGLALTDMEFEAESGQLDGTVAHAFERALGYMAQTGGRRIVQTSQLAGATPPSPAPRPSYVSAFYLPQFHRTPENDAWWGAGFTEWTAATAARPNLAGQNHPQMPTDLGFYDLTRTETMGEQAALARAAGIDAFCAYFYWFDGRRILEAPIDRLLGRPDIDFPFYLCWANESWRRNWDGMTGEVLLDQTYAAGFEARLAADTAPYMRDPRYQRPDGARPRFVIYRPTDMPDPAGSVARLRQAWRDAGIGEVELGAVLFHVLGDGAVADGLFDFQVEMPPHGLVGADDYIVGGRLLPKRDVKPAPDFAGLVYDYAAVARNACDPARVAALPANTIAGVMPSWDNTARRGRRAHMAWGASPIAFDGWLERTCRERLETSYRGELFVNAWNEWAEKAMLEPSRQYGDAMLRVLARWTGGPLASHGDGD